MKTIEEVIRNYFRDIFGLESEQTAETYVQGVRRFEEFLATQGIAQNKLVLHLTPEIFIAFADWISGVRNRMKSLTQSTIQVYLSSVTGFYKYLLRERLIDFSAGDLERIRVSFHASRRGFQRTLPKLPPEEAINALLAAARRVKSNPKKPRVELARLRNIAMMEALRASGMRVGELVGLKRDDLDHRARTALVTGKGDKQHVVFFDEPAWDALENYLRARADGASGRALHQLALFARHDRRAS
ncbi:MAG: tyrosine-type recombinase/integrase [Chloroflexi bacterium]|nr:tyrosine-type recombinase/integrase [Chloroflexota bacterium]